MTCEIALLIEPGSLMDHVRETLRQTQFEVVAVESGDGSEDRLIQKLEGSKISVLLLALEAVRTELGSFIRRARTALPDLKITILHPSEDAEAILRVFRAGADEFLTQASLRDTLPAAIERVTSAAPMPRGPRQGKVIGFLSAKGGCGATTIACHIATELRRQTKLDVLLADLDLTSGMVGFLMKTGGEYSILDAARNLYRLDTSVWNGMITRTKPEVAILAAPATVFSQDIRLEEGEIQRVLRFMRSQHDWTIVDLGRSLTRISRAAMEEIDTLFLVSTLEVPALHGVKNIIRLIGESAGDVDKVEVVLNRAPKTMDMSMEELGKTLGRNIYATLPNDYPSLYESYAGGTLLPPNNRLARHFGQLTAKLAGIPQTQTKKKFSLFG